MKALIALSEFFIVCMTGNGMWVEGVFTPTSQQAPASSNKKTTLVHLVVIYSADRRSYEYPIVGRIAI